MKKLAFSVTPEVLALGVKGIYLVITKLKNQDKNADFESYKTSILEQLVSEYSVPGFTDNDPILQGFRDLHTKIGRSNRKYVSAPQDLVSFFLRTGKLPHINLIVDIYNLISLKSRLALGRMMLKKLMVM